MKKTIFAATAIFIMTLLVIPIVELATVKAIWPYYYIYFYSPRPSSERIYQNSALPLTIKIGVWSYSPEISSISYSLDGNSNRTLIALKISDATYNASGTLTNLEEGSHKLYVYAFDANGAVVISEYETFEVNTLQPSPISSTTTLPTPTPFIPEFSSWTILLIVAIMVAAGLLVYFKKLHKEATQT